MTEHVLQQICDLIQEDVGGRGLRTDPAVNLITATAGDFQAACRSLAATPNAAVGIVTGFFIPHGQPPAGETDGPLGALFLARTLTPLGIRVALVTDPFCRKALAAGLSACRLTDSVPLLPLPMPALQLTHLIALERVGPSHTPASVMEHPQATTATLEHFLREVRHEHHDRCHTMRGRDITEHMTPAHQHFDAGSRDRSITTIGIGDGGNEIGMGKIAWHVIRDNIPGGGLVACRVPTDYLIVCGVSNWGAYGLAAGVALLRGQMLDRELFNIDRERELLEIMVREGPLVDGMTGMPTVTVDGLAFERYAEPLRRLGQIL